MLNNDARYVYEVYRLKSVSNAAEKLFVTQPAISAAIKRVEKEVGAPVFDRRTLPFTLTPEGKLYIEAIEKVMDIESQTAMQISDLQQGNSGVLRIAMVSNVCCRGTAKLLEAFMKKYPKVDVHVRMLEAKTLFDTLEGGLADVVINDNLDSIPAGLQTATLFMQRSVVALPEVTPIDPVLRQYAVTRQELLHRTYPKEKIVYDLSLFRDVEFLRIPPINYINKRRSRLFEKVYTATRLTSGTEQMHMNYNLMMIGCGALLTTDAHLAALPPDTGCLYFVLGGAESERDFFATYLEKQGENAALRNALIETGKEFFGNGNPLLKLMEQ